MAKCRVIKGGWSWMGVRQELGTVILESPEWIANRAADGLVEPIAAEPVIEQAVAAPAVEQAVAPRQKKSK